MAGERLLVVSFPLPKPELEPLTESEQDIARLLLEGCSNAEIAQIRGRSLRTVANQVASIFRKLGVGSRAELAALATERIRNG
jgi:DNA-binding NarL/FixJ family response regulator